MKTMENILFDKKSFFYFKLLQKINSNYSSFLKYFDK